MKFNASKCQTMRIQRSTKPLERFYTLCNHILAQMDKAKYFGVIITENTNGNPNVVLQQRQIYVLASSNETLAIACKNSEI